MKTKGLWQHVGAWTLYCLLYFLHIHLSSPGFIFYPQNMGLFFIILATVFYSSALFLFPKYLPTKRYISLGLGIFLLSVGFALFRYLCLVRFQHIFSPGNPKTTIQQAVYVAIWLTAQHVTYGWGYYSIRKERERYLTAEANNRLEREKINLELSHLKSQFNPHFLYNTLNYLYSRAIPLSEELAEGILKLSDIMRYAVKDNPDNRVALSEEIHHLNHLIELHQARFGSQLHVCFQVEGHTEGKRILPLVLLSFVENAFKHGNLTEGADPLLIHLSATDDQIAFAVQNKKSRNSQLISTQIGVQNVRRRLTLAYADKHQLRIKEDEHHYRCELTIHD